MAAGFSGRVFRAAVAARHRIDILWDGQIYDLDLWAIPKGAANNDDAKRFIGFATYQLDSNLRNSTMVGIVGGGGIGSTLFTAYQRFDYDYVLAILIVIVGLIMVAEIVSGWARRTFQ